MISFRYCKVALLACRCLYKVHDDFWLQGARILDRKEPLAASIEGDWHFHEGERVNHAEYGCLYITLEMSVSWKVWIEMAHHLLFIVLYTMEVGG